MRQGEDTVYFLDVDNGRTEKYWRGRRQVESAAECVRIAVRLPVKVVKFVAVEIDGKPIGEDVTT